MAVSKVKFQCHYKIPFKNFLKNGDIDVMSSDWKRKKSCHEY